MDDQVEGIGVKPDCSVLELTFMPLMPFCLRLLGEATDLQHLG